jgi:hypothetical protein
VAFTPDVAANLAATRTTFYRDLPLRVVMATALHLPVAHTEDDLALAGALAHVLRSEELYVAWSTDGGAARPIVEAILEQHTPRVPLRRPSLYERLIERWRGL